MSNLGIGLWSAAAAGAVLVASGASRSRPREVKPLVKNDINLKAAKQWFESKEGQDLLLNQSSTSAIAKNTWSELSQADKQMIHYEHKEFGRNNLRHSMQLVA